MNETSPYGGLPAAEPNSAPARIRIPYLHKLKAEGRKWSMLTAYDMYTAAIFEQAGIPALLIGDSAANNVYGYDSSLPVTVDELLPLVRAVARSTRRPLIIADLPFGSYQASAEQCFLTAARFMKEGGAHAVKIEGGIEMLPQIEKLASSGVPVMAHIGFTPQSEHQLGGYRVQGKGADRQRLLEAALAFEQAGAFSVLMEMVPGEVAAEVTAALRIPTVGIGAGNACDAQVLVWQDMAGLRTGKLPRFVKQYADLHGVLLDAARRYADDVESGAFPAQAHTF